MLIVRTLPTSSPANDAGVVQAAVFGVVAEQQRADVPPAALRVRLADHDELFTVETLGFNPEAAVAGRVSDEARELRLDPFGRRSSTRPARRFAKAARSQNISRRLGARLARSRPVRKRSIRSATLRRAVARAVGFRVIGELGSKPIKSSAAASASSWRIQWVGATPPSLSGGGAHGYITDMVHGSAEGAAVGSLEEWVKCCSDCPGTGSEEQDWRSANCDAPWRHRAGASSGSAEMGHKRTCRLFLRYRSLGWLTCPHEQ